MNVTVDTKMHNNFRFEVVDAKTGEVKQEAKAENIVTNNGKNIFFNTLFKGYNYPMAFALLKEISVGGGLGTFDPNWLNMIKPLGKYQTTKVSSESTISSDRIQTKVVYKVTLNYDVLVDADLTEIGFSCDITRSDAFTLFGIKPGLVTHAFITDSEGNPITLHKTATDIVNIYATVYFTMTHNAGANASFCGSNLPEAVGNAFISYFAGRDNVYASDGWTFVRHYWQIALGDNGVAPSISDRGIKGTTIAKSLPELTSPAIAIIDNVNRTAIAEYTFNTSIIGKVKEIYIGCTCQFMEASYNSNVQPVLRMVLPIGAWVEHVEEDQNLATGDGTTKLFNLPSTAFPTKAGTLVVKVGGSISTDYTFNNSTGLITFNAAPGAGALVSVSYKNDYIPKHQYNILKVSVKFTFSGLL